MKYGLIGTPIGDVIAATNGRGLCLIELNAHERRFRAEHPDAARDNASVANVLRLLRRYFAGERVSFRELKLDLSVGSTFEQFVWLELCRVPWGEVISYSELARRIGSPRAARAVGNAVGRNPIPIIVPCHRVIRADGSLGGFSCGLEIKRALHKIEGITARG